MRIAVILFIILNSFTVQSKIVRQSFYDALASEEISTIDDMISQLEKESKTTTYSAYRGALLAKKANFIVKAVDKLKIFKAGVALLEDAIEKQPQNIEYRFLRLSIQEHSPKLLKYKENIAEDKKLITDNFSKTDSELARIIKDYTKESEVLILNELH